MIYPVQLTLSVFKFAWTIFRADLNSRVLNSRIQNGHIRADLNSHIYVLIEAAKIAENGRIEAIFHKTD